MLFGNWSTLAEKERALRENERSHRALKRGISILRKADRKCDHIRRLIQNGSLEEAEDGHLQLIDRSFEALGACVDPDVPGVEAAELGLRTFFSKSVGHEKNANWVHQARIRKSRPATNVERSEQKQTFDDGMHFLRLLVRLAKQGELD